MTKKEKRSIILSCVLGDGNISEINRYNGKNYSGAINIKHGEQQADYLKWKAEILSKIKESDIVVSDTKSRVTALNKSYNQKYISWVSKKFRAWKRIFYKNGKKDISKILKFIRHPYFAAAVWFMDDGSSTKTKKASGTEVFTGFVLYICDQDRKQMQDIVEWFEREFPTVKPKIKYIRMKYKGVNKEYPILRFSNKDSLLIWNHIKPFVEQIPSMMYKFRSIVKYAEARIQQPQTRDESPVKT